MSICKENSEIEYIHELPYHPRKVLCDILDVDKSWEDLGGLMHYDVTTLTLIGRSIYCDKSPSWELLNRFSERMGTIKRLFVMLAKIDHQRAMLILKPFVNEKYHKLLRNESTFSTAAYICSKKGDIPKPSFSQLSMLSSQNYSQMLHSKFNSGATGYSPKPKHTVSKDLANFNQQFSSVSLHSNKKVLNVQEEFCPVKKAQNNDCLKRNDCHSKEESISDNCISEKLKNVKPISQDMVKESKHKEPRQLNLLELAGEKKGPFCDVMRLPFEDICKATDNFNKERVLGRGGFGTVYKGEWKGASVAIKRLTPRQSSEDSENLISLQQSMNELQILKCCRFDHILPLYAVCLDKENPCLIYQLMINGSLEDRLLLKSKTPPLTWSQRSHIAECTTKGLNYLHTTPGKPLVHGDIKSANILLDANMDAKIGDFGLTREGPGCEATHVNVSSVHGTECYLPAEYLRHRHLSPQVDIYSYGIVLLEIATGLRPLDPKRGEGKRLADHVAICNNSGHLEALRDIKAGEENMIWFRELIQIGQKCSNRDKKKRPPMYEVLEQFEKIKVEMFTKDKIRRLSNDKENCVKSLNLTPLELQLFYDFQKNGGQLNKSLKLNEVQEREIRARALELTKAICNKADETNCDSMDETSDSSDYCTSEVTPVSNHHQNDQSSSEEKSGSGNHAPLPLLTVLQMKVSEFSESSAEISSNSELTHTSHSFS